MKINRVVSFMLAVISFTGCVSSTLQLTQTEINELSAELYTALLEGNWETAENLLKKGAQLNNIYALGSPDNIRELMFSAIRTGNAEIFRKLDKYRFDYSEHSYLLAEAVLQQNEELIVLLLEVGCDINAFESTALFQAVIMNNTKILELLLTCSPDVNVKNSQGETPLSIAVRNNNIDMVSALVDSGADVNFNFKDILLYEELSLLIFSIMNGKDTNIILKLIEGGADVNEQAYFKTVLMHALHHHDALNLIDALIAAGADVNHFGECYESLLMQCFGPENISLEIIQKLINAGAKINEQDKAVRNKGYYIEYIKLLISAGADLSARDNYGRTALFFIVESEGWSYCTETINYLINAGADINALSNDGWSVLQVVERYKEDQSLQDILISAGAEQRNTPSHPPDWEQPDYITEDNYGFLEQKTGPVISPELENNPLLYTFTEALLNNDKKTLKPYLTGVITFTHDSFSEGMFDFPNGSNLSPDDFFQLIGEMHFSNAEFFLFDNEIEGIAVYAQLNSMEAVYFYFKLINGKAVLSGVRYDIQM
jgi:ankyrin repeat protein